MAEIVSGQYFGRAVLVGKVGINDTIPNNIYGMSTAFGGRSQPSKDRLYHGTRGCIATQTKFVDILRKDGVLDPARTYTTMISNKNLLLGGNGIHVSIAYAEMLKSFDLRSALTTSLETVGAEFDGPNDTRQTARIIAGTITDVRQEDKLGKVIMGIITKNDKNATLIELDLKDLQSGEFVGLTTYNPNTPDLDIPNYTCKEDLFKINRCIGSHIYAKTLSDELFSELENYKVKFSDEREETTVAGISTAIWDGAIISPPHIHVVDQNGSREI